MKLWRSDEKRNDKIIAYVNRSIFKGNPKESETESVIYNFSMQMLPSKDFIEIPFHYLKEIRMQEGKAYIEIFFWQRFNRTFKNYKPVQEKGNLRLL